MLNVHGDKYQFIKADTLKEFHDRIETKASDGYELVTMMSDGSSIMGRHYVAAMRKVPKVKEGL